MSLESFHADLRHKIQQHGRSVLYVSSGFSYTIGNFINGLPELLLLVPIPPNSANGILNDLSVAMIARGRRFDDNETVSLGGKYPVLVFLASAVVKRRYTIQAGQFLGHENYDVMQVVLPDPNGFMPGDPRCAKGYDTETFRHLNG